MDTWEVFVATCAIGSALGLTLIITVVTAYWLKDHHFLVGLPGWKGDLARQLFTATYSVALGLVGGTLLGKVLSAEQPNQHGNLNGQDGQGRVNPAEPTDNEPAFGLAFPDSNTLK